MSLTSLYIRLWFRGTPFESADLDRLAIRMNVLASLSKNPRDRYYLSKRRLSAHNIANRVIFGRQYWDGLSRDQRVAVCAHEFVHIREGDGKRKAKRLVAPSALFSFIVFVISSITFRSVLGSLLLSVFGWFAGLSILAVLNMRWNRAMELRCDEDAAIYVDAKALITALSAGEALISPKFKRSLAYRIASKSYPKFEERAQAIRAVAAEIDTLSREASRLDRHLILLRGVPGAGKAQVGKIVKSRLVGEAIRLNLDDFAPEPETNQFDEALNQALDFRYVIGELYSGRWHTSDPARWVVKFRNNYQIHSFILHVSLQKGYANCRDERHGSYHPRSLAEYAEQKYNRFYAEDAFTRFAARAGADHEIRIDAEDNDWERIADEVLAEI